jgi:hypothetical protein
MKRLATPGWLLCHVVMVALVVTFLRLGWWQLSRAEGGNGLSIGYTLEWPLFSAFVVVIWLREVRSTLRAGRPVEAPVERAPDVGVPAGVSRFDPAEARAARDARSARTDAAGDPKSDYNQYLAWLAEHPNARPSDYRRPAVNEEKSSA